MVGSSYQTKCESRATKVTPKYGVMCTPHHFGVSSHPKRCEHN